MNSHIFTAILAMDAYNRGYDANITLLATPGTELGNATIGTTSAILTSNADQNIGFYAVAYDLPNAQTVISYRGTNSDTPANLLADVWNGWSVGEGNIQSKQAAMAFQFYNSVVSEGANPDDILLTGHSLGGGLAGLVGDVEGVDGLLFDNMPYELDAQNTYDFSNPNSDGYDSLVRNSVYGSSLPWALDESGLRAYAMGGEILTESRLNQTLKVNTLAADDGGALTWTELHSMASLIITMYGASQTGWQTAAPYFWPVLYNESFLGGINSFATAQGSLYSNQQYGSIIQNVLAYSAITDGPDDTTARPFGDTGIAAFYHDADLLGTVLGTTGVSQEIKAYATDISKAFVEFASDLALNQILQSGHPEVLSGMLGFPGNGTFTVSFDSMLWTAAGGGALPLMASQATMVNDLLNQYSYIPTTAMSLYYGSSSTTAIDRVVFAAADSGTTIIADNPNASATKADIFVGGSGSDIITGSHGNDIILAGGGSDTIHVSTGKDIIFGGQSLPTRICT